MKTFRVMLTGFFVALVSFVAIPAMAQKSMPAPADKQTSGKPKDIHTRAKLHTELGALYFQNGNLIVALEELTIATSINPNYAPAYSTRGLVLYYLKEFDSAEKDFQRALNLDDKDPEINNNYGWFLCQIGKEKDSIGYFRKALENSLYQTPEIAFLNLGACQIKIGEVDVAEESIRKSLRFAPDHPQALF